MRGHWTKAENFHITLAFLGDCTLHQSRTAAKIIEKCSGIGSFDIELGKAGVFRRHGGDIENREFRPHITLGRDVEMPESFDITEFSEKQPVWKKDAERVSLMRPDRLPSGIRYTEIYGTDL